MWLDVEILIDLHAEQLALFGGPDGIRDQGMLESALGRPINKFTYGETDLAALAAAIKLRVPSTRMRALRGYAADNSLASLLCGRSVS